MECFHRHVPLTIRSPRTRHQPHERFLSSKEGSSSFKKTSLSGIFQPRAGNFHFLFLYAIKQTWDKIVMTCNRALARHHEKAVEIGKKCEVRWVLKKGSVEDIRIHVKESNSRSCSWQKSSLWWNTQSQVLRRGDVHECGLEQDKRLRKMPFPSFTGCPSITGKVEHQHLLRTETHQAAAQLEKVLVFVRGWPLLKWITMQEHKDGNTAAPTVNALVCQATEHNRQILRDFLVFFVVLVWQGIPALFANIYRWLWPPTFSVKKCMAA